MLTENNELFRRSSPTNYSVCGKWYLKAGESHVELKYLVRPASATYAHYTVRFSSKLQVIALCGYQFLQLSQHAAKGKLCPLSD